MSPETEEHLVYTHVNQLLFALDSGILSFSLWTALLRQMMRKVRPRTCAWDPPSPPAKILGKLTQQRHGVTPPHVLNLLAALSTYFSSSHPLQALAVKTPSYSPDDAGNNLLAWPKGSENAVLKLTRYGFCHLKRFSAPKAPAEGGAFSAPKYTHCPSGMGHSPQNDRWHWTDSSENISLIRCYS